MLETYREVLQDVFDLPALRGLLEALAQRRVDLVEVETPSASPFASSLLFDYVATYMYEDDTPLAERRAQALALDRDLLKELLGQEELRDLIDPAALEQVEASCAARRGARTPSTTCCSAAATWPPASSTRGSAAALEEERRAVRVRVGGEERLIAAEDAGRYRDALGAMPPSGPPGRVPRGRRGSARLDPAALRARAWARSLRKRPPRRFGFEPRAGRGELLAGLDLVRGELRPGGTEREWCDPDVLRRLRRASLARLRKEVEPAERGALGRFLPGWQGVDRRATLREALVPLQGLSLPVSLWESDVLPRRVPGYQPAALDQLTASGEVVWVGAGLERVALYFREDAPALGRPGALPPPEGEAPDAVRAALAGGALFWFDLLTATGLDAETALPALWDLVWAGEVDERRLAAAPGEPPLPDASGRETAPSLLALAARTRSPRRRAAGPSTAGALPRRPRSSGARRAPARAPGIVTRDGVRAEGIPGGYAPVYQELRKLETLGVCRRGYFVEGLGGAQFALPGAVERLRERPEEEAALVLAAADPAQPYGAALAWPKRSGARAARVAGAYVVLLGGEPALFAERGGRSLVPLRDPEETWLRAAFGALVAHVRRTGIKRLAVERFDGEPIGETEAMPLLVEAGFLAGPPGRPAGRPTPTWTRCSPSRAGVPGRRRGGEAMGGGGRAARAPHPALFSHGPRGA